MAEQYKALNPVKYYKEYLSNEIRPDGREFDQFRPVILNVGSIETSDGSAIAKIGDTTVVCGIKAEICRPKAETPNQGFIVPNLELPPLCSPKFKSGPPSDQAQVLSQLIADILINSQCVDLKELCIHPDKIAWCLYIDLICLDYDGSLVDACVLALTGALKSLKLPSVVYDAALDNQQINENELHSITIHSTPVSTTFAVFDDKIILEDPTAEEESLCTGLITIVFKDDELCCVHKPGGSPLQDDQMTKCIRKSKARAPLLKEIIKTAIKE